MNFITLKPNNIGHYKQGVALYNKDINELKCMEIEYGLSYMGGNDFRVIDQAGASKFMLMYYPELILSVVYSYGEYEFIKL